MLNKLDETLMHQAPTLFDYAAVSDHRFYDRIVIGGFHPEGDAAFLVGMAMYKNLNVMDGFAAIQTPDRKQYNVRLSKPLRPNSGEMKLGAFGVEVVEAFRELHLTLENADYHLGFDLTWKNLLEARLENPHFGRADGRVHTDYLRYSQLGSASGTIRAGGHELEASDWFGWRDHSWGIRPGVGGFEPFTGTKAGGGVPSSIRAKGKGLILYYLGFWNGEQGGGIQVMEDSDGERIYMDGEVQWATGSGHETCEIVDVEQDLKLVPGKRVFSTMAVKLKLENGETWEVEAESIGRPWCYRGLGYDSGFNDGKGLGVWRSDTLLIEQDVYDLSDIEDVVMPDGSVQQPRHREQLTRAKINGKPGFAYSPFFLIGSHPRLGV